MTKPFGLVCDGYNLTPSLHPNYKWQSFSLICACQDLKAKQCELTPNVGRVSHKSCHASSGLHLPSDGGAGLSNLHRFAAVYASQ